MDLQSVKLLNFKNYRDERIDFSDNSFWIIRGKNSSGKSTIACDAITYALFGKIKAFSGPIDFQLSPNDIIRRGSERAKVSVEFMHKGNNYVVTRIRSNKGKNGKETVTIFKNQALLMDKESKKRADKWIEENFWTYSDFTNTTLILQDEMTKALELSKSERKDYLERLFGIKDFETMAEMSKSKAKELNVEIGSVRGEIKSKEELLEDPEKLESKRKELEKAFNEINNDKKKLKKEIDEISKKKKQLQDIVNEFNLINSKIKDLNENIKTTQNEITGKEKLISNLTNLLKDEDNIILKIEKINTIETDLDKIKNLEEKKNELDSLIQSINRSINSMKHSLEKEIESAKKDLIEIEKEIKSYENQLQEIESKKIEIKPLENLKSEYETVKSKISEYEKIEKQFLNLTSDLTRLETQYNSKLDNERKNIKTKREEVNQLPILENKLSDKEISLNQIKMRQNKITENNSLIEQVNSKIKKETTQLNKIINNSDYSTSKINDYKGEIEELSDLDKDSVCPKCYQKLTKDHIKAITKELQVNLEKEMSKLEKFSKNKHDKSVEIKNLEIELGKIKDTINKLNSEIEKLRTTADGYSELKEQIKKLNLKQEELNDFDKKGGIEQLFVEEKEKIKVLKSQIQDLQYQEGLLKELRDHKEEIQKSITELELLKQKISETPKIKEKINELKSKFDLKNKNKQQLENKVKSSNYSLDERKQLKSQEEKINQINEKISKKNILEEDLRKLEPEKTREDLKKVNDAKNQLENEKLVLTEKQKILSNFNKQKENEELKLKNEKFFKLNEQVNEIENKLKQFENKNETLNKVYYNKKRDLDDHKQFIQNQKKIEIEINNKRQEIADILEKQDNYELLARLFKHIGGNILSRLRDQINFESVRILSMLNNQQLNGIALTEDFGLLIQTPKSEESPSFFSGGQKVRIGFAFRLALSKVLAEYKGNELETLIIDEGGFGALDEDGQDGVIDVFNSIQDDFQRMLVISHIDNIADNLPGIQVNIINGKIHYN